MFVAILLAVSFKEHCMSHLAVFGVGPLMNVRLIGCLVGLLSPHVHRVLATECACIQEHFGADLRLLFDARFLLGSHNLERHAIALKVHLTAAVVRLLVRCHRFLSVKLENISLLERVAHILCTHGHFQG